MAAAADRKELRDADRDDAADASRFFSRIGYLVLAVGAPVGVVLHPLGLYVMFAIGVGLILIAAALDAEPGFIDRVMRPFAVSAFLALLAGLVWAALSVLWTPYPAAAGQLKSALAITADSDATPGEEGEGSRVSLRKRAFPLVELMDRAAARGVDITWT